MSFTVTGFIAWQLVTPCVLQHDGLWHVQGPDVGVMLDVGTCVSAVCNPEKSDPLREVYRLPQGLRPY